MPIAPASRTFCMNPRPHSWGTLTNGVIPAELAVMQSCPASRMVSVVCSRSINKES